MSKEDLFEYALKCISVKAFDALLTCGVRSLNSLLRLTSEDMRKFGVSERIRQEIQDIQNKLTNQEKSTVIKKVSQEIEENNEKGEISVKPTEREDEYTGTPIPTKLMERLPTRARNVLTRENIYTVERLMELKDEDLFELTGIGRKTVHDIKHLQVKVKLQSKNDQTSKAKDKLELPDKSKVNPFRIRFNSRASEHWPSDPEDWSLLSRSLPELFWITLPFLDDTRSDMRITIDNLGIADTDLFRLREVALLPDDTVDLLLSMSLGYLLKTGISADSFSIILNSLECFSENKDLMKSFVISAKVSDTAIFHNISLDSISGMKIDLSSCNELHGLFDRKNFTVWNDLINITERQIIKKFGLNYLSINTINSVWQLKERAYKVLDNLSNSLPFDSYTSFQVLTDSFVRSLIKKPYHYSVIMGRLGFLDERRWTLEELGQNLHLTRERVRQIEKQYFPVLEKPKVLERLNLLWLAVDDALTRSGGVCCTSEIAASLTNNWGWPVLPSDEALASLISLSSKYEVVWASPTRIIMPGHGCVNCTEIGAIFTKIVEQQPTGTLCFDDAKKAMHSFCEEKSCAVVMNLSQFSNGYLHFLDDAIEEILADEDTLYTQYAWAQKYGKRRLDLVESVLRSAGRAMHFTEVCAEINKDRPEHGKILDRNVHAYLTRSSDILLWDRGTYILRDYVSIPHVLIKRIEREIIRRLDSDIPYLSVSGIYKLFIDELTASNIPSESALYSCLRESSNKDLVYPDYPNIMKSSSNVQRLPITLVLESYVANQEGSISYEELRKYAVEELCINEAVFIGSHLQNIPNMLRIDRGEYIHLNQIDYEESKFTQIINHLMMLLKASAHVSAIKLYNDKKISCRLMGISTPMLLYSLIQFFYSDQFELSRFPKISLAGQNDNGKRATGVASEVIQYVREKNLPCSFAELYQHFVDELGYKQMSIYNIHFNSQIIRYSESVVVHFESLDWTGKKQDLLEKLANNYLKDRTSAGKLFGLISDLYEYFHDQLPDLPSHICWTSTLIGELLSRDGKYRILGTTRNVFVSAPNDSGIDTLDDLLFHVLNIEYDGAANIDTFISDMRDAGILKKSLTPMMLKENGPVMIAGHVVKLARLR